jgi:Spy/CpxP family protein refolding chaperone
MTSIAARPWVILALIFLLGAITGSLLTIAFGPRPGPPGAQQMGSHWMKHLTERLKLSDDQQKKIEPLIMDAEQRIEKAHHEDVANISQIMQETNAKIAEVLQPEQRDELKQMESERERMFSHHLHSNHGPEDFHRPEDGGPPPPPPGSPPAPSTNAPVRS